MSEDDKNRWYRHWVETGLETVERQLAGNAATGRFCHGDAPGPRRLRARAADPQRPAHEMPPRPRADGDARLRELHGRAGVRDDPGLRLPGRGVTRPASWLAPPWAGGAVGALMSTREGGASVGPYRVDEPRRRGRRRAGGGSPRTGRRFAAACGAAPVFLRQVHGTRVVRIGAADAAPGAPGARRRCQRHDRAGRRLHGAGRRLPAGAVRRARGTRRRRRACRLARPRRPACSKRRSRRCARLRAADPASSTPGSASASGRAPSRSAPTCSRRSARAATAAIGAAIRCRPQPGKWLADLAGLARDRLAAAGVERVSAAPRLRLSKTRHGSFPSGATGSPAGWPPRSGSSGGAGAG